MWWIWLVPALVVAAGLLAVAVTALESWHRLTRVRSQLAALTADARRAEEIVSSVGRSG
jgi:hypothetical protein